MSNAETYRFADFTTANYERLLKLAADRFRFCVFSEQPDFPRFVIWRHDVDFSPHRAVKMAELEAKLGLRASYHILLSGGFYNALEPETAALLRRIQQLGHEIGIHLDHAAHQVRDLAGLERALAKERMVFEEYLGLRPACFSFHMPGADTAAFDMPACGGLANASARFYFEKAKFCSDSNGYWRGIRLEDKLLAPDTARLQVLTHPELWQDEAMAPRQRVMRCIEGRAARTREWYDEALRSAGRLNIDAEEKAD